MSLLPNKVKQQYKLVDLPNSSFTCIQLLKPPFRGLVYAYRTVKFRKAENDGDDYAQVSFTYDIIDNAIQVSDEQMAVPEFKNLLGDILMDILEDTLSSGAELQTLDKPTANMI